MHVFENQHGGAQVFAKSSSISVFYSCYDKNVFVSYLLVILLL